MASEYRSQRRVEFAETDMAGVAHFSNFFRYMEMAEHEFLRSSTAGRSPGPGSAPSVRTARR
jgi:acyl-CoA thioesterase FadM